MGQGNIDIDNMEYSIIAKGFEDADAFCTEEPAAVKKDGKWGFISSSGKMVIEPVYEEAKSFSYGYAPVKVSGKWTLIDINGKEVLNAEFADMQTVHLSYSSIWEHQQKTGQYQCHLMGKHGI